MTRLFGTDGIRGEAGVAPLDGPTLRAIGRALGEVLARDLAHPARVVVGRDTRESGPSMLRDLCAGLRAAGADVRSAGVLPTPGVSFLARSSEFDAGIVISASHNPHHDNGVKVFSSRGTKIADALEDEVERRVGARGAPEAADGALPRDEPELVERYVAWLVERAGAAGGADGLFVACDCAHGAASAIASRVLEGSGAKVLSTCDAPDGRNINERCGSLHLDVLGACVRESGADLGVAFDGDADRALFVDASGAPVDGDQVLLLAADGLRASGRLRGGAIVGTVMSNFALERALDARGLKLLRERVGDRFVLERMQAEGCNLGGEPSGHVIFLDEAPTGDGLLTAVQVLARVKRSGRTLAELAADLPLAPQVMRNVRVRERVPLERIDGHGALVTTWGARLGDTGRIVVRYSGTEPLVRVMAEGTDAGLIASCVEEIATHLERAIGVAR
jgi:phosphoglucosamine mutase